MVYAVFALEKEHLKANFREFLKQLGKNMNHTVSDFIIRIKRGTGTKKRNSAPYTVLQKKLQKFFRKEGFLEEVKEQTVDKRKF